jgi:hypothetical protein
MEHSSYSELVRILGVSMTQLLHLEICLRPRQDNFLTDIGQIVSRFGADPSELAKIVRLVYAVEAMAGSMAGEEYAESGFLMAARSRKEEEENGDRTES